ncbi:MAG: hypothetical protein EBS79_09735 [Gammaproteobacteria bacterium]|nr:hypothetical protein [Gammaproteobacteria bacterium]
MATVTALLLTSAGPANAAPKPITFVSHRLHTETLDLGTPGPSMGDISVMTGEILSPNEDQIIGSYVIRKIMLSADASQGLDERDTYIKYKLKAGTIAVLDITENNTASAAIFKTEDRAIVGGTGAYAGAKGVLTATPMTGRPDYFITKAKFK